MRVFARVVPTVSLSGVSGLVRTGRTKKSLDSQRLGWCVRTVRRIFYCLIYARTRDAAFISSQGNGYLFSWDIKKNRTGRTRHLNNGYC